MIIVKLKRMMRGPSHKGQNLIKVRLYPSTVQGEILIKWCTKYLKNQNQTLSSVIHPFQITNRKLTKQNNIKWNSSKTKSDSTRSPKRAVEMHKISQHHFYSTFFLKNPNISLLLHNPQHDDACNMPKRWTRYSLPPSPNLLAPTSFWMANGVFFHSFYFRFIDKKVESWNPCYDCWLTKILSCFCHR